VKQVINEAFLARARQWESSDIIVLVEIEAVMNTLAEKAKQQHGTSYFPL